MAIGPLLVCLPTDDRQRSFDFYRGAFGLEAVGPLADDGVPEPLRFVLNDQADLMLVPRDGFSWVLGATDVAAPGTSECILSIAATDPAAVDAAVERARAAGASVVTEPKEEPWGYVGTVADPDGHLWQITVAAG